MKSRILALVTALSGMIIGTAGVCGAEHAAGHIAGLGFKPTAVVGARAGAVTHASRTRNKPVAGARSASSGASSKRAGKRVGTKCSSNGPECRRDRRLGAGRGKPDFGASAIASESPVGFITNLEERALAAMREGETTANQQWRFRQIYRQYFDTEASARAALGPYWQQATDQQRQEFMHRYEDYVVITYSLPLGQIGAQRFEVLGSRDGQEGIIVTSRIDGAIPLQVDWRLNSTSLGYKVTNVFVNGIDMAELQRSDMVSVIQRNSGRMEPLLAALREKNTSNGITR